MQNFLFQELTTVGFEHILEKSVKNDKEQNVVESIDLPMLVNCTYDLLKRQHHQAKVKEDLEERYFQHFIISHLFFITIIFTTNLTMI